MNKVVPTSSGVKKRPRQNSESDYDQDEENLPPSRVTATSCPICLEPISATGPHRCVATRCGHLFGSACIEQWLNQRGRAFCPSCHAPVKKSDLRSIFVSQVTVADTMALDKLKLQLAEEKRKRSLAEQNAMRAMIQLRYVQQKLQSNSNSRNFNSSSSFDNRHDHISSAPSTLTIQQMNNNLGRSKLDLSSECCFEDDVWKQQFCVATMGSRLVRFREKGPSSVAVLTSVSSCDSREHGLLQINLDDPRHSSRLFGIHTESLRDMQMAPQLESELLLSTSQDRRLVITDLSTHTQHFQQQQLCNNYDCKTSGMQGIHRRGQTARAAIEWHLPSPGFSVAWSTCSEYTIFCGTIKGTVLVYDLRRGGSKPVHSFPSIGGCQAPFHTLAHLPTTNGASRLSPLIPSPTLPSASSSLLCGSVTGVWALNSGTHSAVHICGSTRSGADDVSEGRVSVIPGTFVSMCVFPGARTFGGSRDPIILVSTRGNPSLHTGVLFPSHDHQHGKIEFTLRGHTCKMPPSRACIWAASSPPPSQLSSSSSSSSSSSPNHSSAGSAHYFVASGDEDGSPIIWDARNGNIVQRLTQHKSAVLMVEQWRSKEDQADAWLATISSDQLRLHRQKFR